MQTHRYPSGITAVWTDGCPLDAFCGALHVAAGALETPFCFLYYSAQRYPVGDVVGAMQAQAPDLAYCGCSTSGEITPGGIQQHGALAIILPGEHFTVSPCAIESIRSSSMHEIAGAVDEHRRRFIADQCTEDAGETVFAISLIDGLSHAEEAVIAALDRGLDGIALVGGSAGDDLLLQATTQICNGRYYRDAALVMLVRCSLPCQIFTVNNFIPTSHKLVVTDSDIDRRRVCELNGEPAAVAYARAVGVPLAELSIACFASNPMVVRINGEHYCRSIQCLNEDLSLTFFCAIDNGLVLTLARAEGMQSSTRQAIDRLEQSLGPLEMLFGFDCIHRRLDAENRATLERISELYRERRFVGINTYGEQFRAMHLNQTFTGVAFGTPGSSHSDPSAT